MTKTLGWTLAATLTLIGLAGCSGSSDEPAPVETRDEPRTPAEVETPPPAPAPSETVAPTPTPTIANAAAEVPPEEATAPDEQMLDDAAATGMTARASRDEPEAAEEAPAQDTERK